MEVRSEIRDIRHLADFLDRKFRLPLGIEIGWDALIGLIPVVGDVFTSFLSLYILFRAAVLGCPPSVLLRMSLNILIDNILDVVPVIGNVFDILWQSNVKNVYLVDRYFANPHQTVRRSRWVIAGLLFFTVTFMAALTWLGYYAASQLWMLLQS